MSVLRLGFAVFRIKVRVGLLYKRLENIEIVNVKFSQRWTHKSVFFVPVCAH